MMAGLLLACAGVAAVVLAFLVGRRSALGIWQHEMLESRAQFVDAQQVAHIGSWEVDLLTGRTKWSDEVYRIHDLVPQEIPASFALFLAHVHPDDTERMAHATTQAQNGEPFTFEYRLLRSDGTIRYVQDRGQATLRDSVPVRLLGTTQDVTAQKEAAQALEKARLQQTALLDNLPHIAFLKDLESRFVAVNEPLARLCGVTPCEMIGRTDFDFFPREQAERYQAADRRALERGERIVEEEEHLNGSAATPHWIETTTAPYYDASGALAGIVGITRDVTVRHEAAERLRASAEHYRLLFDRNPLPMWVFDVETLEFLAVNDAAIQHYGYPRESFLSMTIADIRSPELVPELLEALAGVGTMHAVQEPFVHLTRDGRRIETQIISDSIVVDGRQARLVLARDITSERASVRALRESEARYRTLFEESVAGNYVSDVNGRLLACNASMAQMLGYDTIEEACVHSMVQGHVDDAYWLDFLALLEREKRLQLHELNITRRDGSPLHILQNVVGRFDDADVLTELHGFVVDITDRKRLEEQLRHSQKLQAVGQLAGGIAHDFNNLLTAMKLHGEFVLEDMAPTDPRRADILEMQRAADRATMLTRQLLAFSRKQLLKPKVVDANAVIEEMEPMVRRLIGEDVSVAIVLDPAAGSVMADAGQLEQVILNLAVNARDAMAHGGTFTVATGQVVLDGPRAVSADMPVGDYVSITARDTGCGMDSSVLAHLFEPFFTTKEQGKGTGLGLATVYGIVKQSGGHIWVDSHPGAGTAFQILLPRVGGAAKESLAQGQAAPRGSETVLVVEDDPAVQALTHRLLQRQGYGVIVARTGAEALAIVADRQRDIALVLTDVVMPEMSGGELASRLAESHPGLPVLFMSGYTDDVVVRRGLLDTRASFLQKPFTAFSLATAVRETLDASSGSVPVAHSRNISQSVRTRSHS
jgi:two-component system, cell cycle sensor histidine kinase and response regulator CckA